MKALKPGLQHGMLLLVSAGMAAIVLMLIVRIERAPDDAQSEQSDIAGSPEPTAYGDRSYLVGPPRMLAAKERVYARSRDARGRDRLLLFETDQPAKVLLRTEPGQTIRQLDVTPHDKLLATLYDDTSDRLVRVLSCDGGGTWNDTIDLAAAESAGVRPKCVDDVPAPADSSRESVPQETEIYLQARRGYLVDFVRSGSQAGVLSWFEGSRGFVSLLDDDGIPIRPWDIGSFRTVHVAGSVIMGDWCPEPLAFAGGKLQEDPCGLVHFDTNTGELRRVALEGVEGLERGLGFTLLWLD